MISDNNNDDNNSYVLCAALKDLASNRFWNEAVIGPLPWHEQPGQPLIGQPQFHLHQTIVDSLAPAMPLKAVFSRS